MKRGIALLFIVAFAVGCTACGNVTGPGGNNTQNTEIGQDSENETGKEEENVIIVEDACDILFHVWDVYEDSDTDNNMYNDKFPIMGGHHQSYTLDAPAAYNLEKTEDLERSFCIPADLLTYVNDAATMQHMMHANTLTAAAYHIADEDRVEEVVEGIEVKTLDNQWFGVFPDKLLIIKVGNDYVVSAYGKVNVVDYFKDAVLQVYGNIAEISVEKNIRY